MIKKFLSLVPYTKFPLSIIQCVMTTLWRHCVTTTVWWPLSDDHCVTTRPLWDHCGTTMRPLCKHCATTVRPLCHIYEQYCQWKDDFAYNWRQTTMTKWWGCKTAQLTSSLKNGSLQTSLQLHQIHFYHKNIFCSFSRLILTAILSSFRSCFFVSNHVLFHIGFCFASGFPSYLRFKCPC